ncbi:hypothetical protein N8I71_13475 [Roseibacterium sp. SDUM158016]|jgi:hypothetical protein|uniref:hypothetical protein n=1 Tax=Roseicyclus sediminis TaxID=2980997 RepID=UPI0021D2A1CA|nr:hypothetical protein [Roseibacterium sp. SDUM158016]MCU4653850.1 hypothetical protein [Roseibacterium sp. SDUM158016]
MKTARHLSKVRDVGPWRIAAIEEVRLWARASGRDGHRIVGGGEKRPLAILIAGPGGIAGTGPGGERLSPDEIEEILPGAAASMAPKAGTGPGDDTTSQEEEDR